jgi:hypothetical protein
MIHEIPGLSPIKPHGRGLFEPGTEAERIEAYEAQLRELPLEDIEQELDSKSAELMKRLLEAITNPDTPRDEISVAIFGLAFTLMARDGLRQSSVDPDPARLFRHKPRWQGFAKEKITSFVEEEPKERAPLLKTIFFSTDPAVQEILGHVAESSNILPDAVDERVFAAAVATADFVELGLLPDPVRS